MKKIFIYVFLAVISSSCEKEDKYNEVSETLIAAYKSPDTFCSYTADNMQEMGSGEYKDCVDERIKKMNRRIEKAQNRCDEIYKDYVGPPDKGYMLLKCDADKGVNSKQIGIAFLEEFKGIGDGSASCSDISSILASTRDYWNETRNVHLDFGYPEPYPEWSEFVSKVEIDIRKNFVCKTVTRELLGLEFKE